MTIPITLNLPDEIFNRAQSLARSVDRDIREILLEAIALSLHPTSTAQEFSSLSSLTDEEIMAITQLQMESHQDQRVSELLEKQQAGTLSATESCQLWLLMQTYELTLLQKAHGLREAVHRGLIQPLES